mmetsp:Transcript_236/g.754  ORF Transcript_236/g.754 Transcript_236/m.754 type:complete len:139 (-) Transcript_236:1822-2238(-)
MEVKGENKLGGARATVEDASMFLDFCSSVAVVYKPPAVASAGTPSPVSSAQNMPATPNMSSVSPSLSEMSPVSDEEVTLANVVRFPATSRMDALRRYQKKRAQRNFKKVIRYECRKLTAINRPRSKGRFVKLEKIDAE